MIDAGDLTFRAWEYCGGNLDLLVVPSMQLEHPDRVKHEVLPGIPGMIDSQPGVDQSYSSAPSSSKLLEQSGDGPFIFMQSLAWDIFSCFLGT